MKKLIDGRLYDTDTAQRLGMVTGLWEGLLNQDETLYRTAKGAYFLHYVRSSEIAWTGGEWLVPVREHEAQEWAERHLSADEYISLFGCVEA